MEEYAREPCPWRIVDDCGGAFTMGAIGGSLFLAMIEGVGILFTRMTAEQFRPLSPDEQIQMQMQMQQDPNNPVPNPYQSA